MTEHLRLDVIRESDFVIEESEHSVFITGTKFTMPKFDPSTWGYKHLYIQAYHLTLTESISSPGKRVSINTRILSTPLPMTIDVSGKDGQPHRVAANNGRALGAHGANGGTGSNGLDGGTIILNCEYYDGPVLILLARGGNGVQGQNGGNGQRGATGSNARDRSLQLRDEGEGHRGGNGGRGGNAGRGGKGGKGGLAGNIILELHSTIDESLFDCDVSAGQGGLPGANGSVGQGGPGGRGGRGTSCYREAHDRAFIRVN